MKQTDPQYKLRLPQEVKDQVEAAAKESGRSMNAEIVSRLEDSFKPQEPASDRALMLQIYIAGIQGRADILEMRTNMVRRELSALQLRQKELEEVASAKPVNELTDYELERMSIVVAEMSDVEAEIAEQRSELERVKLEHSAVLTLMEELHKSVDSKHADLKRAIAEYEAAQAGRCSPFK